MALSSYSARVEKELHDLAEKAGGVIPLDELVKLQDRLREELSALEARGLYEKLNDFYRAMGYKR